MKTIGSVLAVLAALASPAHAQESWPARQVTVIVPFAAGGTADMFGRMLAAHLQTKYGRLSSKTAPAPAAISAPPPRRGRPLTAIRS